MTKFFTLLIAGFFCFIANARAQTATPATQPYGKVDKSDLEMTSCDFEKDANAEVLFAAGSVYFDQEYNIAFEHHVRIKVFNDNGKDKANIKLRYRAGNRLEYISGIQAETINLNNGSVVITKVDKKQILSQRINKLYSEFVFSFPDVKPGSIIEYKYVLTAASIVDFPDWYFQTDIPTRYSEIKTDIPSILYYKNLIMVNQPYVKNTADIKAIANVPSLRNEPHMSSRKDNTERILFELTSVNTTSFHQNFSDTWQKVGTEVLNDEDFGGQLKRKVAGEDDIINKAKSLPTTDQKIAFVFNEVKNTMKWDEEDDAYTNDGTTEAWNKKVGNSTEINLILNHLLQKAGVNSIPMLVSTRVNGKINPAYPNGYQFNKAIAYVPVDSASYYLLDASDKYNIYNEIPEDMLNGFGFYIDKANEKYELLFIQKTAPVREVTLITAEIKPDGKMTGTADISSLSYNRIETARQYKTDGEEKFIKSLTNGDNNLKISALKMTNMEVDTLPLMQHIDFNFDLTGSDENYIYFKPNLFSSAFDNDFLSEHRFTDIDFGYMSADAVNGVYKIPVGYKADALPKSVSMAMSDNSILFKRMVAEQDGSIFVRYSLSFKKSLFFKENYEEFHSFFKKMNEMMNEQIVLKKA